MLIEQKGQTGESNAYSLFVYAVRSQVTRDYYLRRLRIFINYIGLLPEGSMEDRCNIFAKNGIKEPNWAFSCIVKFFQFQRERVEKQEITGATLRNFVKAIKLFCEMSDIPVTWKKISRGLNASLLQKFMEKSFFIVKFFIYSIIFFITTINI